MFALVWCILNIVASGYWRLLYYMVKYTVFKYDVGLTDEKNNFYTGFDVYGF